MASLQDALPPSTSASLAVRHPTAKETAQISVLTATEWAHTLPLALYLKEQAYLSTVPLAKDGGMTTWILVDTNQLPDERPILASCETYRERALVNRGDGKVEEVMMHGVASVFCAEELRGRGYAGRMLRELSKQLRTWQVVDRPCVGSILYSDIGRQFYAKLGWHANNANTHVELKLRASSRLSTATAIETHQLAELCAFDEALLRKCMATTSNDNITRMTIIPDADHMLWHHATDEYACNYLFGKTPHVKGAIAGSSGNQVHAIWTHRYYDHLDAEQPHNVLYILRLVVEADPTATRLPSDGNKRPSNEVYRHMLQSFKAVLLAAQAEAAAWKLNAVQIWDPTPLAKEMLRESGLKYVEVERENEHIASILWYADDGEIDSDPPLWVNCEHYAWM